ncbi:hypothetical protein [Chitinophaga cymbidii]|uniref:Alpha-L-rhamnosidase six-hairpin glycosidase domain-containing protein n=1 Tax=Chitinophaga cymbidii TaxID=1096750 RepID=A0A512RFB2_9BACT|nr:hypothetical protein [Chitinophaga cymbidii]GEP94399.1 hypothetical protein CCY01nite_06590 [Chitinophaga cymbidii]
MSKRLTYTYLLLLGSLTARAQESLLVEAEDFQFKGGWQTEKADGRTILRVFSGKVAAADALTVIDVKKSGNYAVWVRTPDYPANHPGTRLFSLHINEQAMPRESGQHGKDGYYWEKAGSAVLEIGENVLRLKDTRRNFGRCDAILLTSTDANPNEQDIKPAKAAIVQKTTTSTSPATGDALAIPKDARTIAAIQNDKIRLRFVEGTDKKALTVTDIRKNDQWISMDNAHESNRIFLLNAVEPQLNFGSFFPSWKGSLGSSSFTSKGKTYSIQEPGQLLNPFLAGKLSVCHATTVQQTDDHTLAAEYQTADGQVIKGTWQLPAGAQHLQLTLDYTPAQQGYYSFVVTAFQGIAPAEVTNVQLPPMFQYQRLPEGPVMLPSAMMPQPLAIVENKTLTTFITAAPSTYPLDWAQSFTSRAGFSIKNEKNNVQPVAFAPVLGLDDAKTAAGQSIRRSFVIGAVAAPWQDALAYISDSIYRVKDYRKQEKISLTEAAFNIIDLIKNDTASGWAPQLKGFYDIEADPKIRPTVVQAAPLAVISAAVIGRDEALYINRALPTIEYTLSRSGFRWANGIAGTLFNKDKRSLRLSPFNSQFTTAYYEGLYQLLQQANPWLKSIALPDNAVRNAKGYSVRVPEWSQELAAYRMTKDRKWLDAARKGANAFLDTEVYGRHTTPLSKQPFYNTSFYANWWDLPDLYDITADSTYLRAAEDAAFHTLAGVRTYPLVEEKMQTIHPKGVYNGNTTMWWKGGKKYRLGFPRQKGDAPEKQVPQRLVSPVGLGFEQPFTFFDPGKLVRPVFMSSWAPHLLRLSGSRHGELFETYARNAVIGRFTNYPGYYGTGFTDITMQPDFPYKGPDVSSIYYHHIPPHLAFTLDFLLTSVMQRAAGQISFPYSKQDGFVWFNNRIFGGGKGQVFDDKDVSLWMKKGLIQIDNPAVNYVTATSGKHFWVILMNEAQETQTCNITMSSEAPVAENAKGVAYPGSGAVNRTVTLEGKGFTAIAYPLSGKQSTRKITPLKHGMQEVDFGPGIGKFYAFRIRSPFGWDSIYGYFEDIASEGATASVTINHREEIKNAYPYEWSYHPLDTKADATIKIQVRTRSGKTFDKSVAL